MGQIAYALFIGGWMISLGSFLIYMTNKEEKKVNLEREERENVIIGKGGAV